MDKKLEQRVARLEKLITRKSVKNESGFVRRVNTNKPIKFNSNDLQDVEYITLYVNDDYIDSISTTGYGAHEVIKRLMLKLKSYVDNNVKGRINVNLHPSIEFSDADDNLVNIAKLPAIYTDSRGRIEIAKFPLRDSDNLEKACLIAFDKYCLI